MRVAILVADGYVDSPLGVLLDVFRTANTVARRTIFDVAIGAPRPGLIRAASGMRVEVKRSLGVAAKADIVLVASQWVVNPAAVDVMVARPDVQRIAKTVARAHARGAIVGAGCSAVFVLGEAGVLEEATTAWWLAPHLKQRFPAIEVVAARSLIARDRVISAGAALAAADLALHLVARFGGPNLARRCAGYLLLTAHGSQASFMALQHLSATDPTVQRAERWARAHLSEDFAIPALAKAVGTSARTFARRIEAAVGLSPIAFVQRLRVESATHLLATTRLSLAEIATQVGYADPSALSRLIERETNKTPRELRPRPLT